MKAAICRHDEQILVKMIHFKSELLRRKWRIYTPDNRMGSNQSMGERDEGGLYGVTGIMTY